MSDENLKQWILKQRLSNYGYDRKSWQRMSGYKSRVFNKLRNTPEEDVRKALAQAGILGNGGRLQRVPARKMIKTKSGKVKYVRSGQKVWDYTTGQSFNEELINIATIGATKGKRNFWEIQERWFN